jgi:MFS family permease
MTLTPATRAENASASGSWWREMTPYHWLVFIVASMAWMFDCLDQQLFLLARGSAMKALLPPGTDAITYAGYATSIFILGWATGGLIFGALGDRHGRARMLTVTVLIYSVCTGLSAFSQGWLDFALFRFLTGLGVGGVFGLAVALVADTLPDSARTSALGLLQALSGIGNITAGIVSMYLGHLEGTGGIVPGSAWKYMFLVGAIPAFLCVFIQMRLKEPEKWVRAREASRASGVKAGSYAELLGNPRWRGRAFLGMLMCASAVIGLWSIGFFSPELVGDVMARSLAAEGMPEDKIAGGKTFWIGVNSIVQNIGAMAGALYFTSICQRIGRRPAFAMAFVAAFLATAGFFQFFNGRGDIWMSAVMGACQVAIFGGFAIYLPELFPTSLRSTGTSFCYNVGRFIAATGPFTMGSLQAALKATATTPEAKLEAFRTACSAMSVVFLLGLVAIALLPETKGQPLPE